MRNKPEIDANHHLARPDVELRPAFERASRFERTTELRGARVVVQIKKQPMRNKSSDKPEACLECASESCGHDDMIP
jgi:hypothetical protein